MRKLLSYKQLNIIKINHTLVDITGIVMTKSITNPTIIIKHYLFLIAW